MRKTRNHTFDDDNKLEGITELSKKIADLTHPEKINKTQVLVDKDQIEKIKSKASQYINRSIRRDNPSWEISELTDQQHCVSARHRKTQLTLKHMLTLAREESMEALTEYYRCDFPGVFYYIDSDLSPDDCNLISVLKSRISAVCHRSNINLNIPETLDQIYDGLNTLLQMKLKSRVNVLKSSGKVFTRLSALVGAPTGITRQEVHNINFLREARQKRRSKAFCNNPLMKSYSLADIKGRIGCLPMDERDLRKLELKLLTNPELQPKYQRKKLPSKTILQHLSSSSFGSKKAVPKSSLKLSSLTSKAETDVSSGEIPNDLDQQMNLYLYNIDFKKLNRVDRRNRRA